MTRTSENGRTSSYVLKCDIRKFFDSIDHKILLNLLKGKVTDRKLLELLEKIENFCKERLLLDLHPRKVEIRKLQSGTDFLGYVTLPSHTVLRTRTKKRMLKRLANLKIDFENGKTGKDKVEPVVNSYLGMLSHCKGNKLEQKIKTDFLFLWEKWCLKMFTSKSETRGTF